MTYMTVGAQWLPKVPWRIWLLSLMTTQGTMMYTTVGAQWLILKVPWRMWLLEPNDYARYHDLCDSWSEVDYSRYHAVCDCWSPTVYTMYKVPHLTVYYAVTDTYSTLNVLYNSVRQSTIMHIAYGYKMPRQGNQKCRFISCAINLQSIIRKQRGWMCNPGYVSLGNKLTRRSSGSLGG